MNNNTKSNPLRSLFSNHSQECVLICLILAVSFLVQLRTGGSFLSASNLNELMREASMLMIVSIGMTIVIVSGGIDLSVGSVMGLAGMISVLVLRDQRLCGCQASDCSADWYPGYLRYFPRRHLSFQQGRMGQPDGYDPGIFGNLYQQIPGH